MNRVQSPTGLLPDFRRRKLCWTMPLVSGFSRGSPVPLPLHSGATPFSPHFTLIGSQDLVVKMRPKKKRNVGTPFANQRLETHPPADSPANSEPFIASSTPLGHEACSQRLAQPIRVRVRPQQRDHRATLPLRTRLLCAWTLTGRGFRKCLINRGPGVFKNAVALPVQTGAPPPPPPQKTNGTACAEGRPRDDGGSDDVIPASQLLSSPGTCHLRGLSSGRRVFLVRRHAQPFTSRFAGHTNFLLPWALQQRVIVCDRLLISSSFSPGPLCFQPTSRDAVGGCVAGMGRGRLWVRILVKAWVLKAVHYKAQDKRRPFPSVRSRSWKVIVGLPEARFYDLRSRDSHLSRVTAAVRPEQEDELASHCRDLNLSLYGLTFNDLRKLAFEYAEACNIVHGAAHQHVTSENTRTSSEDILPDICEDTRAQPRRPEATDPATRIHSGAPCFVSLSGHLDHIFPWFPEIAPVEFRDFPVITKIVNSFIAPDTARNWFRVSKSNATHVTLSHVHLSLSGKYSCEVSADAPSFHTAIVTGEMDVVAIGPHGVDTSWRTLSQSSPSTVTSDNQCAVDIGISIHKTVEPRMQVIELANSHVSTYTQKWHRVTVLLMRAYPFAVRLCERYLFSRRAQNTPVYQVYSVPTRKRPRGGGAHHLQGRLSSGTVTTLGIVPNSLSPLPNPSTTSKQSSPAANVS
ncbi:hypothetical protein PR048_010254 [Dryococelus australis]|uniref:Ig-like domain-containing protein n=1 Tax=Dryococelus australis TaxID=614101 RepID=A0ABQ9I267_9NEOP|nr:hypothetical protein PR048_010254 [Dryococelus australis]